jgi:hypothetical protein
MIIKYGKIEATGKEAVFLKALPWIATKILARDSRRLATVHEQVTRYRHVNFLSCWHYKNEKFIAKGTTKSVRHGRYSNCKIDLK